MVWYVMIRYGMVWYDVAWYGMVWYGMLWYGIVWYGMVWYGTARYGMVWYGMVWHGTSHNIYFMEINRYFPCSTFITVADPAQCFACDERDAATCTANQRNLTCAKFNQPVGPRPLGTTHCGSAAITYLDYFEVVRIGFIRGCFDCAGKITFINKDRFNTL